MEAAAATSPFINSAHHYHHAGNGEHQGGSKRVCNFGEPETGSILDPFQIEDLLDFSNEDIAGPIGDEPVVMTQQQISSTNNSTVTAVSSGETKGDASAGIGIASSTEFPIDCGDMPELEWLSKLVEDDSFMDKSVFGAGRCTPVSASVTNVGNSTAITTTTTTTTNKSNTNNTNKRQHSAALLDESSNTNNVCKGVDRFQVGSPISVLESSSATSGGGRLGVKEMAVPGRPRSKRMRTGVNSWKNSPPRANGNNTNSNAIAGATNNTNTTNNTNSCSPDTSSVSDYNNNKSDQHDSGFSLDNSSEQDVVDSRPLEEQPQPTTTVTVTPGQQHLKQYSSSVQASKGKPPLLKTGGGGGGAAGATAGAAGQEPRRCTHCLSQKTPQWRAGPEGPKTLCNACGVRYKSGRLYPEYRPALSPTFVSDLHSNSHRKVLEMRKQKQVQQVQPFQAQPGEVLDDGEQLLIYK